MGLRVWVPSSWVVRVLFHRVLTALLRPRSCGCPRSRARRPGRSGGGGAPGLCMATARRRPRALGQLLAQGGRDRARQVLILVLLVAQALSTQEGAPTRSPAWCTLLQPASHPALPEWLRTIDTYCTVAGAVMHRGLRTALPRAPQPVAAPLAPASAAGALGLCSPSLDAAGARNPSCTGFAGALRCGGSLGAAGALRGGGCAGAGPGAGAAAAGAAEGVGFWVGPGAGLPNTCRTTRVSPLASGSAAATAAFLSSGRRSTCSCSNVAVHMWSRGASYWCTSAVWIPDVIGSHALEVSGARKTLKIPYPLHNPGSTGAHRGWEPRQQLLLLRRHACALCEQLLQRCDAQRAVQACGQTRSYVLQLSEWRDTTDSCQSQTGYLAAWQSAPTQECCLSSSVRLKTLYKDCRRDAPLSVDCPAGPLHLKFMSGL